MPTDEQIAEFGRQMRKEAKQIVKTIKQIQKEVKQQKFTAELGNTSVDVVEGKIKLQEAVKRLRMATPLRFTNPPCLERKFRPARVVFSKIIACRLEERHTQSYVLHITSSKETEKMRKFYRPMLYPALEVKAYNRFTEDNLSVVRLHEKT